MIRLFKHYIPNAVLLLGLFDVILLFVAGEMGWTMRANQIGMAVPPIQTRVPQLVTFALTVEIAMIAVGVYGASSLQSLRFAAARLLVAISLGVIFLSAILFMMPTIPLWRSNLLYSMAIAVGLLIALRLLLGKTLSGRGVQAPRRRARRRRARRAAEGAGGDSRAPGSSWSAMSP